MSVAVGQRYRQVHPAPGYSPEVVTVTGTAAGAPGWWWCSTDLPRPQRRIRGVTLANKDLYVSCPIPEEETKP